GRSARKTSARAGRRTSRGVGKLRAQGRTKAVIGQVHKGGVNADAYAARQQGAELLATSMVCQTPEGRRAEWALEAARHPRAQRMNVHVSFSRPAGHALTDVLWRDFVRGWMREVGADGCSYVLWRHHNTDHDHVHLIFGRSRPDGKLVDLKHNYQHWGQVT